MARHPRRHVAGVVALIVLATVGGRSLVTASVAGVTAAAPASEVAQQPATTPEPPARMDAPGIETALPIPYPDEARAAGVEGPVALMVTTDPQGQPSNVDVVAGEAVLTAAAIGAVSQWRFAASDRSQTFLLGVNVVPRDPSLSTTMSAPVRIGGTVRPPQKVANVSPVYPVAARDAGVQGIVILEARIGPDGIIDSAHVLRSIPALDVAALMSVVQWRYTPTVVDGVAVPVGMTVTVNFTLQ